MLIPKEGHVIKYPSLSPALVEYLSEYLRVENPSDLNKILMPGLITEKFKKLAPTLLLKFDLKANTRIQNNVTSFEIEGLLTHELNATMPPTKQEIQSILNTYTPGIVRSIFSGGKTEDIERLENVLHGKNDPLSDDDLKEISEVVKIRNYSSLLGMQDTTETTRVFLTVYARIETYLEGKSMQMEMPLLMRK